MQPMLVHSVFLHPAFVALTIVLTTTLAASAQSTAPGPSAPPGPINPSPNPQAQPGATIVINPTQDECRRGWTPALRWTQEQFREFCEKLGASK